MTASINQTKSVKYLVSDRDGIKSKADEAYPINDAGVLLAIALQRGYNQ